MNNVDSGNNNCGSKRADDEDTVIEINANEETRGACKSFVIAHNVSKRHNIGNLARSCSAFGVNQIILTGNAHYNLFGSHGADKVK